MTTTLIAPEYLTGMKFRNAVKKALTGFTVIGKNETSRRYTVRIQAASYKNDGTFTITYRGGDIMRNEALTTEKRLEMEHQLVMAGFEKITLVNAWEESTTAWRKAVNN
jgi:hypothetical protein